MNIGKKMGLGFGVLLALVASIALVALLHMSGMHRQFSSVIQHDAPVIANARHLLTLVIDMETGQRGFVITGKDEFLEPYERAIATFAGLLAQEKALVSDNPSQVKLLERIDASLQAWQEQAALPEIAMRRKVSKARIDAHRLQEILSRGVGKRLMDKFMALGHDIEVSFSELGDWEGAFAVEIIEKSMADREDGQRGFLITGQEEFLDKYHAGEQKKLPQYFARLRTIVSQRERDDELSKRIDQLEALTKEWTSKAAEPEIAARREMNEHPESLKDVAALLEIGTGQKIIERIREDFRTFIEAEERWTSERFASASQASRSATNITLMLAFVSMIFGGAIALKITRGITQPIGSLTDALALVAQGDLSQQIDAKSKDEIGELARSFNRMVNDLKQLEEEREQSANRLQLAKRAADTSNQAKSEFLANMSHEIRTPMTAILGFAENLEDKSLSSSEKLNAIQTIRRNGQYLLGILNDILDLSKIEAGKMGVESTACQPCRLVADVLSLMRVRADEKGLQLYSEYIGAIPETIRTDATRLRQILINMIGNAIKFTEVGEVRLVTQLVDEGDEPHLQFDVIDTGRGMNEEQRTKLFLPFTQGDTSVTRKVGGTGLGLTISKRLAELLGGDISVVETEKGVGTTFRATVTTGSLDGVALLADPKTATVVVDAAVDVEQNRNSGLQGIRILLAEDGPDNQRLISHILRKAGADVTIAENGKLALDSALIARDREEPFDCILMDMQMPVMDGYEATRQLRQRGVTGPIIALTAHAMASDRQKCIDTGCDDYHSKPINRSVLIDMIRNYMPANPPEGTSPPDAVKS